MVTYGVTLLRTPISTGAAPIGSGKSRPGCGVVVCQKKSSTALEAGPIFAIHQRRLHRTTPIANDTISLLSTTRQRDQFHGHTTSRQTGFPTQTTFSPSSSRSETSAVHHGLSARYRHRCRRRRLPRTSPNHTPRLCSLSPSAHAQPTTMTEKDEMKEKLGLTRPSINQQGRAGLVAWRRSRGGVGALGKAFYKGGFEPRMTKREAALILSLK
ncbi:hypothetical protein VTJ49DRAFT_1767 [Mycothermus thermophilus]|uniref:Uncharacterized protein n=1 Tax=Humicola insolens TaxID=85995 RepID=A0ABR3VNE1_HUMIN